MPADESAAARAQRRAEAVQWRNKTGSCEHLRRACQNAFRHGIENARAIFGERLVNDGFTRTVATAKEPILTPNVLRHPNKTRVELDHFPPKPGIALEPGATEQLSLRHLELEQEG